MYAIMLMEKYAEGLHCGLTLCRFFMRYTHLYSKKGDEKSVRKRNVKRHVLTILLEVYLFFVRSVFPLIFSFGNFILFVNILFIIVFGKGKAPFTHS